MANLFAAAPINTQYFIGSEFRYNNRPLQADAAGQLLVATQPVIATAAELITSAGVAVDKAFLSGKCMLVSTFGFNSHATTLHYVQLWEGNSGNFTALTSLRAVFPVQPNKGVFSLDLPIAFVYGCSIAISSAPNTFTTVGNQLVFTALVRDE